VLVPLLLTLYISRFVLGITCAFSIGVAGMYIRQTFSERLRRTFGSIYSLSKMMGTEVCYIIGYILNQLQYPDSHLIVFWGAGMLSVVQCLLVVFFLPEVPVEMLTLKKYDRFNSTLYQLYCPEDIPTRIRELEKQEKDIKAVPSLSVKATKHKVITALHSGLLRQFCGAPFVIVYSVYIFGNLNSEYTAIATLIINTVQVGAGVIGLWLVSSMQRSRLVIVSTFFAALLSFAIAVGDATGSSALCLTAMILYMMPTASCLQSVTWFYPFECTGPLYGKYASLLSWFGTACLLIIPPFVTEHMPRGQSYPIFIFFGVYLCFSVYMNLRYFVNLDSPAVDVEKERAAIELSMITTNRSQLAASPVK
jgi:MFS family permease